MAQMMPWDEFLAGYKKAGGTPSSKEELDSCRVLVAVFGIHFTFLSRRLVQMAFERED